MDSKEVIELIRVHKKELEKFGVKRIGIFGLFTRDETSEESDIDLLLNLKEERGKGTFKNFGGLVEYLENLFGRSVDILTPTGIESIRNDEIKKSINRELYMSKRRDKERIFLLPAKTYCVTKKSMIMRCS